MPYSQARQTAVADELKPLPADDPLRLFVSDYGVMREEARACLRAAK